jgi:hypothetical protein
MFSSFRVRALGPTISITAGLAIVACSPSASPESTGPAGGASMSSNGAGTGGSSWIIAAPGGAGSHDSTSGAAPERCDDAGANCKCIAIANIGAVGSSGTTVSYNTWLNTKSNARVDSYPKPVRIDGSFLAQYDELIFQDISSWTITAEEASAIAAWVRDGGGLMSMSGYQGSETEIAAINTILKPLGFAYSNMPGGGGVLWMAVRDWNPAGPIATNMGGLGVNVHNGRPVLNLNADSPNDTALLTIAQAANGTTFDLGYTATVGSGHVFPWSDEWVTYTSDWDDGTGTLNVEQFWYNAVAYLAPATACKVVISDPHVVVN